MKYRTTILIFLLGFSIRFSEVKAGELPEILQRVLVTDTSYQSVTCKIDIVLDVDGVSMPDKQIELRLEKGKKPRIESEGITILPKHGIIGQYREFLELECQALPISENGDTLVFKVVSLDKKTDWVTVDLEVTRPDARVHSMLISTRKNGEFLVRHRYGNESGTVPEETEISFEAVPLKLPLKFMGRQEGVEFFSEKKGPVTGRIILRYSDVELIRAQAVTPVLNPGR